MLLLVNSTEQLAINAGVRAEPSLNLAVFSGHSRIPPFLSLVRYRTSIARKLAAT